MTILIVGNPVDGFEYIGPFTDSDAAIAYAESSDEGADWWIATVVAPPED